GRGVGCPFYALACRPREERANRNDRSALFFPFQHHRFCALTDAGGRQAGAGKGRSMSAFSQLPIPCAASRRSGAVSERREAIAKTNPNGKREWIQCNRHKRRVCARRPGKPRESSLAEPSQKHQ